MNISANEVHLWFAYDEEIFGDALLSRYRNILSQTERSQIGRFRFAKHRHQHLVTRALVRVVLSLYVKTISPSACRFRKNDYGKPYVEALPHALPLRFNISHTESLVVLAVTLKNEIGVDVECVWSRRSILEVAETVFSPTELAQLNALPVAQQVNRFYELWTLKEAYIKACGMGLSISLDHFSYSFPRPGQVKITFDSRRNDHEKYWNFWQIEPDDKHKVSLAVTSPETDNLYTISMLCSRAIVIF